jgi:arabinofuranan 3-O-arabinosyltransferase
MCGSTAVRLRSGANDVDLVASELFVPRSVVLSTGPRVPAVTGLEGSGDADPSRRSVQPVAPDGLLVLRQNVNKGWEATRGNTTLTPAVVDGWQQAWHAGPGDGPVTLTFGPDRFYRGALLGGLFALFALMLLALLPLRWWRRLDDASLHGRTLPPPVLAVVGLVVSGLLAGWTGVVIGGVSLAGASVLQRRWPMLAPWLLGALVVPSALAYALRPWGGEGAWAGSLAWPHYLVVLVVAALCARPLGISFLVLRPFRRRAGRSTKR